MRGERLRRVRIRAREDGAVGGKRVDGRCFDAAVTVRRETIDSKRVDRDEEDRSVYGCRGAREPPSADCRQRRRQGGEHEDECVADGARQWLLLGALCTIF